jgi:hypothetical protein
MTTVKSSKYILSSKNEMGFVRFPDRTYMITIDTKAKMVMNLHLTHDDIIAIAAMINDVADIPTAIADDWEPEITRVSYAGQMG